jgi:hypothetical protein
MLPTTPPLQPQLHSHEKNDHFYINCHLEIAIFFVLHPYIIYIFITNFLINFYIILYIIREHLYIL